MEDENKIPKPRKSLQQMQIETLTAEGVGPIQCPGCECKNFKVSSSWMLHGVRKRIRRCRNCGMPITTLEMTIAEDFGLEQEKEN
jgi:hypothetical protein